MAKAKEPTGRERAKIVYDWLERNDAQCAWVVTDSPKTPGVPYLECHIVHQVPVILAITKHGWELYVPSAPHQNNGPLSLDCATVAIGPKCQGARGLAPDGPKK